MRQKRTAYSKYMAYLRDHDQDARNAHRPCPSLTREQADRAYAENDISKGEWTRLREAFEANPREMRASTEVAQQKGPPG